MVTALPYDLGPSAHLAAALALSGPLVYAGVAKLMAPATFVAALPRLGIRSRFVTPITVGAFELLVASALLLSDGAEIAFLVAATYFVFTYVLHQARRAGEPGDCGCFGALRTRIDSAAVRRNAVLAVLSVTLGAARTFDLLPSYDPGSGLAALIALGLASAVVDTLLAVRSARHSA